MEEGLKDSGGARGRGRGSGLRGAVCDPYGACACGLSPVGTGGEYAVLQRESKKTYKKKGTAEREREREVLLTIK
jgi:hypothetical protein